MFKIVPHSRPHAAQFRSTRGDHHTCGRLNVTTQHGLAHVEKLFSFQKSQAAKCERVLLEIGERIVGRAVIKLMCQYMRE